LNNWKVDSTSLQIQEGRSTLAESLRSTHSLLVKEPKFLAKREGIYKPQKNTVKTTSQKTAANQIARLTARKNAFA